MIGINRDDRTKHDYPSGPVVRCNKRSGASFGRQRSRRRLGTRRNSELSAAKGLHCGAIENISPRHMQIGERKRAICAAWTRARRHIGISCRMTNYLGCVSDGTLICDSEARRSVKVRAGGRRQDTDVYLFRVMRRILATLPRQKKSARINPTAPV